MRTMGGIVLLAILCGMVTYSLARPPRQEISPYDVGGGGGQRLCYHEVDPEGRIGPALLDASFITMRNGQGKLFVVDRCDRAADPGFRPPS